MDLLFSKYASPYLLLDQVIEEKRLMEFIYMLYETKQEKELTDIWLHKVFDKNYIDFKEGLKPRIKPSNNSLKATIKKSYNMLNKFSPS